MANTRDPELPIGLQADFKGKIVGKGCRVCDRLTPIPLIVQWCGDRTVSGILVMSLWLHLVWALHACYQEVAHLVDV